jgi:hypothetical protein
MLTFNKREREGERGREREREREKQLFSLVNARKKKHS